MTLPSEKDDWNMFIVAYFVLQWEFNIKADFFPFSARHIAIVAIITNHLLTFVRNVRAYGGKPLQRVKHLGFFSVF